jgi:hypothetical protein
VSLASPAILSAREPDERRASIADGSGSCGSGARRAEAPSPGRPGRRDLRRAWLACRDELEAERAERRGGTGDEPLPARRDAVEAIALDGRSHQLDDAIVGDEARDSGRYDRVSADDATEQRAPREANGHEVCDASQLDRRPLGGGDEETRIREAALARRSCGASGCLGHPRRDGVETEDERRRLTGCGREDRSTIARAGIDRHPPVAGDEIGNLTDVHLNEAASNDEAQHARQDT